MSIEDTIRRIEAAVADVRKLERGDKEKLARLLEQLKAELHAHGERPGGAATSARTALGAVKGELEGYTISHPAVVAAVNEISGLLSRLGI